MTIFAIYTDSDYLLHITLRGLREIRVICQDIQHVWIYFMRGDPLYNLPLFSMNQ